MFICRKVKKYHKQSQTESPEQKLASEVRGIIWSQRIDNANILKAYIGVTNIQVIELSIHFRSSLSVIQKLTTHIQNQTVWGIYAYSTAIIRNIYTEWWSSGRVIQSLSHEFQFVNIQAEYNGIAEHINRTPILAEAAALKPLNLGPVYWPQALTDAILQYNIIFIRLLRQNVKTQKWRN